MKKDFDAWNILKKSLEQRNVSRYVNEREVWWCSLGINLGVEIDGKNEYHERPILILKKYNGNSVLALPLTSQIKRPPHFFVFEHAGEKFSASLSQVRIISTKRLNRLMYRMDRKIYEKIQSATCMYLFKKSKPALLDAGFSEDACP